MCYLSRNAKIQIEKTTRQVATTNIQNGFTVRNFRWCQCSYSSFRSGNQIPIDVKIKYKARYFIGGHRDRLQYYLFHGAQTLQATSVRLLIELACADEFNVWSSDVELAYSQYTDPLLCRFL